jgi:hypothetical protein
MIGITALVLTEAFKSFCLVTDAASEFNVLVTDAATTASISRSTETSRTFMEHCFPEILKLAFGKRTLHANLLADFAFHPSSSQKVAHIACYLRRNFTHFSGIWILSSLSHD